MSQSLQQKFLPEAGAVAENPYGLNQESYVEFENNTKTLPWDYDMSHIEAFDTKIAATDENARLVIKLWKENDLEAKGYGAGPYMHIKGSLPTNSYNVLLTEENYARYKKGQSFESSSGLVQRSYHSYATFGQSTPTHS